MGVVLGVRGREEGGDEGGKEVVEIEGVKVAVGGWKSVHWWVGRNCDFLEPIGEEEEEEEEEEEDGVEETRGQR